MVVVVVVVVVAAAALTTEKALPPEKGGSGVVLLFPVLLMLMLLLLLLLPIPTTAVTEALREVSPACSAVVMMCFEAVTRASTLSHVDSHASLTTGQGTRSRSRRRFWVIG